MLQFYKNRFSFNVKGGRCEACRGDGVKKIEMHFLPDVYIPCEVCHGTRYNSETLKTYWEIGRLIVEAQDGETRAKYGNALIDEWSKKLTKIYGNGYKISNLKYMRQFYLMFQKSQPLIGQLTWTHYLALMPIKETIILTFVLLTTYQKEN